MELDVLSSPAWQVKSGSHLISLPVASKHWALLEPT